MGAENVPPPYTPVAPQPKGPPQGPLGTKRNTGTCILLAIVTLGIYTFIWTYKTHTEMKAHSDEGLGGVLGLVVYLLISPVTFFVVPSEIRRNLYEPCGAPSPVKGTTGLWVLLPLVGLFVWFPKVNGALNNYWAWRQGAGQQPTPTFTA